MTKRKLPLSFKPILWSLKWENIDVLEDKDDIIINTLNEGTLDQWRWIARTYGKTIIRQVLAQHLDSEFHPESRSLAKIIFDVSHFRHARRSTH